MAHSLQVIHLPVDLIAPASSASVAAAASVASVDQSVCTPGSAPQPATHAALCTVSVFSILHYTYLGRMNPAHRPACVNNAGLRFHQKSAKTHPEHGRLNQSAHWARARGPGFFFTFFEGPQLVVVKYFFKLSILSPSQRSTVKETR